MAPFRHLRQPIIINTLAALALSCGSPACRVRRGPERAAGVADQTTSSRGGESPLVIRPVDDFPPPESQPAATAPAPREYKKKDPTDLSPEILETLPSDRRVSLIVPDASAAELARMLGRAVELNIIVDDTLARRGMLELRDVSARDAFAALAKRFSLRIEREGAVLMVTDAKVAKKVSKMLHAEVSDYSGLEQKLKPILGEGAQLSVSAGSRTVYVEAPEDRVEQAEEFIRNVALEERQVAIEAQIYEVTFDDRFEFGVQHNLTLDVGDSTLAILQNLLPDSNRFGATAANSPQTLTSTLRALRSLGSVELLSAPRIATMNGQEASIEVIQEVPYVQSTNTVSQGQAGGTTSSVQQVEFKEAGITLKVKPAIMNDGSVRLDVTTNVSQVGSFFQNVPVIDRRTLQSIVFLADGGTFFLGGLMQRYISDIERKVPLLGDIPVLGLLFTQIDQQVKRKELLILLTARVFAGVHGEAVTNEFKLRYRDEKASVEGKRGGTWLSGGDMPAVK